jgi:hypothetical protein
VGRGWPGLSRIMIVHAHQNLAGILAVVRDWLLPTGSHFLSITALTGSSALRRFIGSWLAMCYSAIPISHCGLRVGGTRTAAAGPTSLLCVNAYERFRKSGGSQIGPGNFAEPPTLNAALVAFAALASRNIQTALEQVN